MRRRSIVAPILLIGIGALLLARNLSPDLALSDYIANYWPYVLIGWGALRLAEIVMWAANGKPLPACGVGGGEWVLVVFLIILGTGFHAGRNLPQGWGVRIPWGNVDIFNEHYEYPVSADRAVSKTPHITIDDFRGDLTIMGSMDDSVKVTGRKTIGAVDKKFADEANGASNYEIAGDDNNVTIRLPAAGPRRPLRISGTLEISVPKGASVTANRRDGDIRIAGVDGAVVVTGRGSDVSVEDVAGPVSVEGRFTGSIHARNVSKAMTFKGRNTQFAVEKIPGELTVDSGDLTATDIVGPTSITSRSADLRLTGFTNSMDVTLQRGDLHLEPGKLPLGPMHLRSRSGDIRLELPEGAQFSIHATTNSGDISNSFNNTLMPDAHGAQQTLRGSVGSGPSIDIETRRGDISIAKGSAPPALNAPEDAAKKELRKIEQ
jgi:DUF4097 and DUF4098 domain-containing protein YvlB